MVSSHVVVLSDYLSGLLFWKKTYVYAEKCGNHLVMKILLTSHSLSVTVSTIWSIWVYRNNRKVFVNGYRSDRMNVVVMWNEMMMMLV